MKKLLIDNWKRSGIKISVYFIIFLIVLSTSISFYKRQVVGSRNEIRDDMERSRYLGDKYNLTLLWADVGFRGYYMIPQENFLDPFIQARKALVTDNEELKEILAKYNFDVSKVDYLTGAMQGYFEMLDELVQLKNQQNDSTILDKFMQDPGLVLYKDTAPIVQEINEFTRKIDGESLSKYQSVNRATVIFQLILLGLGLPTLVLVILRINRNDKRRKSLFNKLDESNKIYIFDSREKEDDTDESTIINNIVVNLQKATDFIQNITEGNYEIRWEGMTDDAQEFNQTNISGELIKMRDQMIRVKKEDQVRLWGTEGTSKFAEIVRTYDKDLTELSDNVIREIVHYTKSNQGGLFIVNDDEKDDVYLELASCYAFERKKFLKKRIEPGENLVGQVFLEKKTIYMIDVPNDYVRIKSGLGDAPPTALVIVPMMFNETVEGIIELASFNEYKEHEIELLEKLAEIIAASLNNAKTQYKTKALLENSKQQTEEMRAQEEEMMQNMEELQATQEEMKRKTEEYENVIKDNAVEIANLKDQLEIDNRDMAERSAASENESGLEKDKPSTTEATGDFELKDEAEDQKIDFSASEDNPSLQEKEGNNQDEESSKSD